MILFKPQKNIFKNFDSLRKLLLEVGDELLLVPKSFPSKIKTRAVNITDLEHKADKITHKIISEVNRSFITPLDREDLHLLAHRTDEVIDLTENAVSNLVVYGIKKSRDPLPEFCQIIYEANRKISAMIQGLKNTGDGANLFKKMVEINDLETEGDELLKKALSDLFKNEKNTKQILKWKDIFQTFEQALDRADDVANIIEGIVIKNT